MSHGLQMMVGGGGRGSAGPRKRTCAAGALHRGSQPSHRPMRLRSLAAVDRVLRLPRALGAPAALLPLLLRRREDGHALAALAGLAAHLPRVGPKVGGAQG